MSNYSQTMIKFIKCTKNIFLGRVPVILDSCNLEMTNSRTDEMAFFRSLRKIGADENKVIYSIVAIFIWLPLASYVVFLTTLVGIVTLYYQSYHRQYMCSSGTHSSCKYMST